LERAGAHAGVHLAGFGLVGFPAVDLQPIGVTGRQQEEAHWFQRPVAPGAGFDRDRAITLAGLPSVEQGMGGVLVTVTSASEIVGCGGLADPHADLEGPFAQGIGMSCFGASQPLQLQGADQGGGTAKLIQVSRRRL